MAICENDQSGSNPIYDSIIVPMTGAQAARATAAAGAIRLLDETGNPASNGRVGFVSIGPSSMVQIFNYFMTLARRKRKGGAALMDERIVLCNGAEGGHDSADIANPQNEYWAMLDEKLSKANLSAAQVQVVWVYAVTAFETAPFPEHVTTLHGYLESILNILRGRFSNLKIVMVSGREYGGYASILTSLEPWAREGAYAVNALVDAHADEQSPWVGWGPYTWADGLRPRADGLVWRCEDFEGDGCHPGTAAERKITNMLLSWLDSHPAGAWFSRGDK